MQTGIRALPSLELFRGFVAVGRRMSITLAAQDLCLTQSAVSRQIRDLEERLQVQLLVRSFRAISLTPEGEQLFRVADACLRQLQDAAAALDRQSGKRPVVVTASIGVAGLWLLPRLGAFQRENPGVELRISADNRLSDLRLDDIDLAIRYGPPGAVPPGALRLFGESVAPVARADLADVELATADDFRRAVLIEFETPRHPWLRWGDRLAAVGLDHSDAAGVLRFNQYDQVIQAVLEGQGIALGRLNLLQSHIRSGRLSPLRNASVSHRDSHGYWLVHGRGQDRPEVRRVAEWIAREAHGERAAAAVPAG